jgi:hypothetical protein
MKRESLAEFALPEEGRMAAMMGTFSRSRRSTDMRARGSRLILLCRLAILAATVVAIAPGQPSARTTRGSGHHHVRHRLVRPAAPQPFRLHLPAPDDFGGRDDGWREFAIGAPASVGEAPRTAIDYRLVSHGPIGSLGLLRHHSDPRAVPPDSVGPASTLRRGYPEVTAGAQLAYPF